MLTPSQLQRLSAAAKSACLCEQSTGLPAEITVAQWALESGWGASAPGNNCFGVKVYPGCKVQTFSTWEVIHGRREQVTLEFAAFDNLADCFEKHAALITSGSPYAAAWARYQASRNLVDLINGIAPVYATDPGYAGKVARILSMDEVQAALKIARS
jgi:flagellar protein FlgJ